MSFIQNNISSLVQEQTVSGASTVNFTNLNNSGFSNFRLLITNLTESINSTMNIRISTDGSTYINTGYTSGSTYTTVGASSWFNTTDTTGLIIFPGGAGVAGAGAAIAATVYNITSGTSYILCNGETTLWTATALLHGFFSGRYNTISTAAVAIQVTSSGTMAGNFFLYGYL